MNNAIEATIANLRSFVSSSADGDLPLWGRLQLWKAMNAQYGNEASIRRSCMALHVCDGSIPRWEQACMPGSYHTLPRTLCEISRHFLGGIISKCAINILSRDYSVINEDCMCRCDSSEYGNIVFLYYGCRYLLFRIVDDDDAKYNRLDLYARCDSSDASVRPTEDGFAEPSMWDSFYVASLIATEDMQRQPGVEEEDARRRFWLNWLDEVVPLFCGDINDARKLVRVYLVRE